MMKYYMTVKLATVGFRHLRSGGRGVMLILFAKGLSLTAESKQIHSKCIPYTITKMFKAAMSFRVKRNVLANATFNYDVQKSS